MMGGAGAFMAARVLVYYVKSWGTLPHPNGRAAIKAPTLPIFHPRPYGQPDFVVILMRVLDYRAVLRP